MGGASGRSVEVGERLADVRRVRVRHGETRLRGERDVAGSSSEDALETGAQDGGPSHTRTGLIALEVANTSGERSVSRPGRALYPHSTEMLQDHFASLDHSGLFRAAVS